MSIKLIRAIAAAGAVLASTVASAQGTTGTPVPPPNAPPAAVPNATTAPVSPGAATTPVPGATTTPPVAPGTTGSAAANRSGPPITPIPVPLIGPPIRRIESASALSTETMGTITSVRQLSNGRLLLNDGARRRLLLLDSALKTIDIILDSIPDSPNSYGLRSGGLIAYHGDTSLFVDPATFAMLVIDGNGKIVRVRSVPRVQDVSYMSAISTSYGIPGFDAKGRLVYRIPAQPARPAVQMRSDMPVFPQQPDSAFLVAIDFESRKLDTLGAVRIPRTVMAVTKYPDGGYDIRSTQSPLPLVDDWAVLPDGRVALVRGRDFRIDYLNADGQFTSSEKLPFPWVQLSYDQKVAFVDSMKVVETKNAKQNFAMQMIIWSNVLNKPYPATFVVPETFELRNGIPRDWILPKGVRFPANYIYGCPPAMPGATPAPPVAPPAAPGAPNASGAPACLPNEYAGYYGGGYTPPAPTYRAPTLIPASEMPDYKPPIPTGAVRADADGNLWIRTIQMKPMPGGQIYDIVNAKGELADRIQLPVGYSLAGFGPGKVVYLGQRDAQGLHLARVVLR